MKKLSWEAMQIMRSNKDGSFSTQASRKETIQTIENEAKDMGYNRISIDSLLKEKCIRSFVTSWTMKGISPGTIKNRMSHVRWFAKKKNVASNIPTNRKLGIENRIIVTNENKASQLDQGHLAKVNNDYIADSLRYQSLFGVRREESIKTRFALADKGNHIKLKASWCKGSVGRTIPILTAEQKNFVREMKEKYGINSLIPSNKSYKQQKNIYKNTVSKIGLGKKAHGLRHHYAQERYKELTGNNCPVRGGKRQREMNKAERTIDKEARLIISSELGHAREQITSTYLGS